MFKYTLILFALVGFTKAHLPVNYKKQAAHIFDACTLETNTDPELVMLVRENGIPPEGSPEEAAYKPYLYCAARHLGIFRDGMYRQEGVDEWLRKQGNQAVIYQRPLLRCRNQRGPNVVETAWQIFKCVTHNLPPRYRFMW